MRLRFWLGYAVVVAIAVGSLAVAALVHDRETDNFDQLQRSEAARSARQVEAVARLSVGQLASAAAFYQTVSQLTRHKFDVMADSLLANGALSGTGLLLSVPGSNRERFERRHGYPILERAGLGFRRDRARAHYYPLLFGASDSKLKPPLGYDLGSDSVRAPFIRRARDSGKPTATRVIHLPIGGTGINVFRPVYRDGAPTATVAERRAALTGFAIGSFHVPNLTAAAASALSDGVRVQLIEDGHTVAGPHLAREESATAPLHIADRTWLLVVRDPSEPGIDLPALIAVFGLALAALLAALVLVWSRTERMQDLEQQASHDPLTGLKNRRRFGEDLRTELARSRREQTTGAVLMLDLDNFKQVNDTLGHPVGDRVIADIADVLSARMRATDVVARLGGDEFAIVLPRCDLDEARRSLTRSPPRSACTSCRERPRHRSPPASGSRPSDRARTVTMRCSPRRTMLCMKRSGLGEIRCGWLGLRWRPGEPIRVGPPLNFFGGTRWGWRPEAHSEKVQDVSALPGLAL